MTAFSLMELNKRPAPARGKSGTRKRSAPPAETQHKRCRILVDSYAKAAEPSKTYGHLMPFELVQPKHWTEVERTAWKNLKDVNLIIARYRTVWFSIPRKKNVNLEVLGEWESWLKQARAYIAHNHETRAKMVRSILDQYHQLDSVSLFKAISVPDGWGLVCQDASGEVYSVTIDPKEDARTLAVVLKEFYLSMRNVGADVIKVIS